MAATTVLVGERCYCNIHVYSTTNNLRRWSGMVAINDFCSVHHYGHAPLAGAVTFTVRPYGRAMIFTHSLSMATERNCHHSQPREATSPPQLNATYTMNHREAT